jgi:hypothetical protein
MKMQFLRIQAKVILAAADRVSEGSFRSIGDIL